MSTDTDNRNGNLDALAGEVGYARVLLEALLVTERSRADVIVVGNFDRREISLIDFPPAAGHTKRLLVPKQALGANGVPLGSGVISEVLEQNEGRLGGWITNTGASPARLFLATLGDIASPTGAPTAQATQRASIWLAANGGQFQFRQGVVLYGGTVCAMGVGGATTLDVAEL